MRTSIGDVLGIEIKSKADLCQKVEVGFKKRTLDRVLVRVTDFDFKAERVILRNKIIPSATYKRRNVLNMSESERVERIARVYTLATEVWDDEDDARQFLFTPHPMLHRKRPIDLALSDLGAQQAEEVLERLRWGLPA